MLRDTWKRLHDARRQVAPHSVPRRTLEAADSWRSALEESGWHLTAQKENYLAQHWPDARHFLRAAHQLGVTGGALSRGEAPLLSRAHLRAIEELLDDQAGGCTMTYHTGLFIAQTAPITSLH